jgi:L-amino acid N-acyltransferase YncA
MVDLDIRAMRGDDWPAIQNIYADGIATGNATFETETPEWTKWDQGHSGVAEVSVYVAAGARGCGVGKALLQSLVEQSERCGIWTLQAGIFPENVPSIALHKSCGFREVGLRQKLGQRGGIWRDVLLLERRSASVGV